VPAEAVSGALGDEDAGEQEDDHTGNGDVVVQTEASPGFARAILYSAEDAKSDDDCLEVILSVLPWIDPFLSNSRCIPVVTANIAQQALSAIAP
jgi:hypothetical protein